MLDHPSEQGADGLEAAGDPKERAERAEASLRDLQTSEANRAVVLETANQVALDILGRRTGVEALRHIADAARMLSGARYAALGVARPNGKGLQEFVTVGLTTAEEAAIGPRPRGVGVLGLLLERTEPLRSDSLTNHPAAAGFPPNHPPMKSFLGVPIRRGDTILGSLYLTDKKTRSHLRRPTKPPCWLLPPMRASPFIICKCCRGKRH